MNEFLDIYTLVLDPKTKVEFSDMNTDESLETKIVASIDGKI